MDLIQGFITTNRYQTYLEIGISKELCWREIQAPYKTGVDPMPQIEGIVAQDSDTFFKHNTQKFDCVFIDGDHQYEQIIRDINNAWQCLNPRGVIILHDMMPVNHIQGSNPRIKGDAAWCGDVYKANFDLRSHSYHICEIDHGCGIVRHLTGPLEAHHHHIDFQHFENHADQIPRQSYDDVVFLL